METTTMDLLLEKKMFGTLDRLVRGVITEQQAISELNGDHSHNVMPAHRPMVDGVFNLSWSQIEAMQGGKLRR